MSSLFQVQGAHSGMEEESILVTRIGSPFQVNQQISKKEEILTVSS